MNSLGEQVAQYLQSNAKTKLRNVSAAVVRQSHTAFGGRGAGADDEFEIASVTKTFTAELLRRQVDAGDIQLSTTVGDVLGSVVAGTPIAATTVNTPSSATHWRPINNSPTRSCCGKKF